MTRKKRKKVTLDDSDRDEVSFLFPIFLSLVEKIQLSEVLRMCGAVSITFLRYVPISKGMMMPATAASVRKKSGYVLKMRMLRRNV